MLRLSARLRAPSRPATGPHKSLASLSGRLSASTDDSSGSSTSARPFPHTHSAATPMNRGPRGFRIGPTPVRPARNEEEMAAPPGGHSPRFRISAVTASANTLLEGDHVLSVWAARTAHGGSPRVKKLRSTLLQLPRSKGHCPYLAGVPPTGCPQTALSSFVVLRRRTALRTPACRPERRRGRGFARARPRGNPETSSRTHRPSPAGRPPGSRPAVADTARGRSTP